MGEHGDAQAILYFVDGYHGGTWGHMPLGAWRDILEALERHPEWKISLDIEPISWDDLKRTDPYSYAKLAEYLKDAGIRPRVEMVAGSYAQPFAWAISGESNIRHLLRGRELIEQHFPGIALDTYAVQEPCWTSSMPQILRSLGFKRAVLKNSTCWGGYASGFDAELVEWIGPDGTSIPCVPRYACEDLFGCHAIESAGYQLKGHDGDVPDMRAFVRKCLEQGILRPSGMCLQDLGWQAGPWLNENHVQFVTWREYVEEIVKAPAGSWRLTQEDIRCVLPWGEGTLQRLAREVRRAENRILVAEKVAAIAKALWRSGCRLEALQEAWDKLLYSQHHDIWICATTREGRNNWAWQASAATFACEEICSRVIEQALDDLTNTFTNEPHAGELHRRSSHRPPRDGAARRGHVQWLYVVNTLGSAREGLAQADVVLPPGTQEVRIRDKSGGDVPVQLIPRRRYPDGSINTATVLFKAATPALGWSAYRCEAVDSPARDGGQSTQGLTQSWTKSSAASSSHERVTLSSSQGILWIESDLYRIAVDTQRGGAIKSLYHKKLTREFCDPAAERAFNEYRGYFIAQGRWRSSLESPVEVETIEEGPLRAKVALKGQLGGCPVRTTMTVTAGEPRIDFHVQFHFLEDTWIGDPWDIKPERRRFERRRSHHDDRWKLLVSFPASLHSPALYKEAPFDVCRSALKNTYFQSWDEIKHNIIHRWVDLYDEADDVGLALFTDHTTSYVYGEDHPLSLTLAWGWEGGFWWGKRPLRGRQEVAYSIIPHAHRWSRAGIPRRMSEWSEPLLTVTSPFPAGEARPASLLHVLSPGDEVVTLLVDGRDVLVRLFHAHDEPGECSIALNVEPESVELVELDGTPRERCGVSFDESGAKLVRIAMPPFGLRTLRLRGILETAGKA